MSARKIGDPGRERARSAYAPERPPALNPDTADQLAKVASRLTALTVRRNELIHAAAAEGASTRVIGQLVGLSHTRVQQIVRGADAGVSSVAEGRAR